MAKPMKGKAAKKGNVSRRLDVKDLGALSPFMGKKPYKKAPFQQMVVPGKT